MTEQDNVQYAIVIVHAIYLDYIYRYENNLSGSSRDAMPRVSILNVRDGVLYNTYIVASSDDVCRRSCLTRDASSLVPPGFLGY